MKACVNKNFTLSHLVGVLQSIAYEGKALYEVDLDLPTHAIVGFEVDDKNQKVILKSQEI